MVHKLPPAGLSAGGRARQHARLGRRIDHPVKRPQGVDVGRHANIAVHHADAAGLEVSHVRLGSPPPEAVEDSDREARAGREKPATDRRPHKPAATSDENLHGSCQVAWARRSWAATIWSKVSPREISGRQPG